MVNYLGEVCSKALSVIFVAFAICALGYLLGRIEIKGISLGSAGVLLVALAYGVLCSFFPSFHGRACALRQPVPRRYPHQAQ